MISPVSYRFQVSDAIGTFRKTVPAEQSFLLGTNGLRASVTPEQTCQELTMVARNGPLGTGLQLQPLDLITLEVTADYATWTPIYYGELRQGGNPNDYTGENMICRGLDTRLRETPSLDGTYNAADGGDQAGQIIYDALQFGYLGRRYTGVDISNGVNAIVRYDPAYFPHLGFTAPKIELTNQQPIGVLLDNIVTAGAAAGVKVRWGVRPDRYVTMQVVRTDNLTWISNRMLWKEPQCDVVYTAVTWAVEKRTDTGKVYYYTSHGPDEAKYGGRVRQVQLVGVNPWTPRIMTPVYNGVATTTPPGGDTSVYVRDNDPTSSVTLTSTSASVSAALTVPAGGISRFYVDATSTAGSVPRIILAFPGGNNFYMRATDAANLSFTKAKIYEDQFAAFSGAPTGLPAGTVITLQASPIVAGGGSSLVIREFRLEELNTVALDAGATAFYRSPEPAPGDLRQAGILLPSEFAGRVVAPRPEGGPDYTGNVSVYEYTLTTGQGAQTTVKTGDPDPPEVTAQNTLIRRLASNTAARAVLASPTL